MKLFICTENDPQADYLIRTNQHYGYTVYRDLDQERRQYVYTIDVLAEDQYTDFTIRVWRAPDAHFNSVKSGTYYVSERGIEPAWH